MLSIARNGAKICSSSFHREKNPRKVFHEIYYPVVTPAQRSVGAKMNSCRIEGQNKNRSIPKFDLQTFTKPLQTFLNNTDFFIVIAIFF
jgi:hypothetical protein